MTSSSSTSRRNKSDGYSSIQADFGWAARLQLQRFRRDYHYDTPAISARRKAEDRRAKQLRSRHQSFSRRWAQTALSDRRLQAWQGGRARTGCRKRVRSQPYGTARAAALRGWREG